MKPKIEVATHSSSKSTLALAFFSTERSQDKSNHSPEYKGASTSNIARLIPQLDRSRHFFGKKNEVSLLRFVATDGFTNTLLLGCGHRLEWKPEIARQIGATLYNIQKRERLSDVTVRIDALMPESSSDKKEETDILQAFCEGYWLGAYEFVELKKEDKTAFHPEKLLLLGSKSGVPDGLLTRASAIASAVNFARFLGDRPGNWMTPTMLAQQAQQMAKQKKLLCTIWGPSQITKEKMGLFMGVAKGSQEEPRFIILEYKGAKKTDRPLVLVGKGITFDSGGISLKPAARMEDMKYDMMGAATVLGAMQAIAELSPNINVTGIVATCENMPSGNAQKPGDVAKSATGKTVEIINTDAEGRLILADALEYAQKLNPQAMIDFATLTGAVLDALGTVASAVMGNHEGLIERIKRSAEASGERVWQLPLYDEYQEDLKSVVADIKNSGVREAGSSKGGIFLRFFVDPKFPWAHCDIAGTAYHRKDVSYHPPKHGSGVLVRLVAHLAENWAPLPSTHT